MRGVHHCDESPSESQEGSSPHARGPPAGQIDQAGSLRIIPACAGSTLININMIIIIQDHPRMRGVHCRPSTRRRWRMGSSPHARGPPKILVRTPILSRIIPACAGSTHCRATDVSPNGDHPRMRGVHSGIPLWLRSTKGSSPHARGPLRHPWRPAGLGRIIPACAGSTVCPSNGRRYSWDHPRMRGVHTVQARCKNQHLGSSPHARGPPNRVSTTLPSRRIIPACAGST